MSSRPHTRKLAELAERELRAKQAQREAELAAQTADRAAAQAEQAVIRAHAGHGELRKAERALAKAEGQAKDAGLKARGAALRLEEAQTEVRRYKGTWYRQLIEESEPEAARAIELLRKGVDAIRQGQALWAAQAQLVNDLLIAGGLRPGDNMPTEHELSEVARMLRSFDGTISPPLPHYRALHFQQRDEQTKARMRQGGAAA